eukprot:3486448-Rhodomonas_salina.2
MLGWEWLCSPSKHDPRRDSDYDKTSLSGGENLPRAHSDSSLGAMRSPGLGDLFENVCGSKSDADQRLASDPANQYKIDEAKKKLRDISRNKKEPPAINGALDDTYSWEAQYEALKSSRKEVQKAKQREANSPKAAGSKSHRQVQGFEKMKKEANRSDANGALHDRKKQMYLEYVGSRDGDLQNQSFQDRVLVSKSKMSPSESRLIVDGRELL